MTISDPNEWLAVRLDDVFPHVVAGMHIGQMNPQPKHGEFNSVLSIAVGAGTVEDGVRNKHLYLPYVGDIDRRDLDEAAFWVQQQVQIDRTVLIRSDSGRQRPGLVAGYVILRLGGRYLDAVTCVRKANPAALSDFRYLNMLRGLDAEMYDTKLKIAGPFRVD